MKSVLRLLVIVLAITGMAFLSSHVKKSLSSQAIIPVKPFALNPQWLAINRAGAPNSNFQCFTSGNVGGGGGYLVITAQVQNASCMSIDEAMGPYSYTSGFVMMQSFNYTYGYLEYRARFGPCNGGICGGMGNWPLVWMESATCQASDPTGTNNSCTGDEIDVSEFLNTFTTVNQQIHVNSDTHNDQCSPTITDASVNWHVYDLVWSAGQLSWYIDGLNTCNIVQAYVPSTAQYVKFTSYVGGQGGGTITPSTMPWLAQLDYLRVGIGCSGMNPLSGCSSIPFTDDFQ
jgi:hypothetical protein